MNTSREGAQWVVCQLGAREHYAVARALHRVGHLQGMFTDAWVPAGSPWRILGRRLADRFTPGLGAVSVGSSTGSMIAFEAGLRVKRLQGWDAIMARNEWFQRAAIQWLEEFAVRLESDKPKVLFAYSYASLSILRWAKERGWKTVLGQIDGGIEDEGLICSLSGSNDLSRCAMHRAPAEYWDCWRMECALADEIVVNSNWSKRLLCNAGVGSAHIDVVPLAYEPPSEAAEFDRVYPEVFTKERPLRVLFLGQLTARKGIFELFDAASAMRQEPVEFFLVGLEVVPILEQLKGQPNIRMVGSVPRSEAQKWYREADVFLFPTHSDGFGLTQLEAQAWKLPVIASKCCGDVVLEGVNGAVLPEVSAESIEHALRRLLTEPELLRQWAANSRISPQFSLDAVAERLVTGGMLLE